MNHADHDADLIVDQGQGVIDEIEAEQDLVDQALRRSSTIQAKVRTRRLVRTGSTPRRRAADEAAARRWPWCRAGTQQWQR